MWQARAAYNHCTVGHTVTCFGPRTADCRFQLRSVENKTWFMLLPTGSHGLLITYMCFSL